MTRPVTVSRECFKSVRDREEIVCYVTLWMGPACLNEVLSLFSTNTFHGPWHGP